MITNDSNFHKEIFEQCRICGRSVSNLNKIYHNSICSNIIEIKNPSVISDYVDPAVMDHEDP